MTFRDKGEMKAGAENIEFGYLLEAHTRGDIYVYFRDSNVLAVGDVASPLRDPALDWYAGGWLGGRVDAMDDLLALANDDTQIVPAYGPVMTRAQLQAERDMMAKLYDRTTTADRPGPQRAGHARRGRAERGGAASSRTRTVSSTTSARACGPTTPISGATLFKSTIRRRRPGRCMVCCRSGQRRFAARHRRRRRSPT